MRDILLWAVLLLLVGWLWAQGAEVTLAWEAPPPEATGAVASRLYERQAGECVLNAAQYTPRGDDLPLPTTQVTLTVEVGQPYCWLVRFVDRAGQPGLPSYVLGYVVPKPLPPPPQGLRLGP